MNEKLEKEIEIQWKLNNPIDEGMGVESAFIHIEAFDMIARHFYSLALEDVRKEVDNLRKHYLEGLEYDNGWNSAVEKIVDFIDNLTK